MWIPKYGVDVIALAVFGVVCGWNMVEFDLIYNTV